MSVIVQSPSGKIVLLCKGADTVILERMSEKSKSSQIFAATQEKVDKFANEGLRTLFLAEKTIEKAEYDAWNKKS
jgi:magnesium-transporting ATPase (P-type)